MFRIYHKRNALETLYVSDKAVMHIKEIKGVFRVRMSLHGSNEVKEQQHFAFSKALVDGQDFMLAAERDESLPKVTQHSRLATA